MHYIKSGLPFAILGWFCGLVILSVLGVMAFWILDTRPPILDIHTRFVRWDEERPGLMWIARGGVRVRQCPGQVHRWVVGRAVVPLPASHLPYPQGTPLGPFEDEIAIEVPDWATQITAYRATIEYACNPIQRIMPLRVIIQDVPIPPKPGGSSQNQVVPPRDTSG